MAATVIPLDDIRRTKVAVLFEGDRHGGVPLSFYETTWPPDDGPKLHSHPYAEVFLVHSGRAEFTSGGETVVVEGGNVVIVPAETPHLFRNAGDAPLHVTSMHPNGHVAQTTLDPA
jgi:mannose-6-phosphate isomerase-like protein (cupin superfamily)